MKDAVILCGKFLFHKFTPVHLIIEKNGEKFGIVAVCERQYTYALKDRMGCRPYDEYDTMEDIRKAKAECDRVFVAFHGGKELIPFPSPRIQKLCRAMVQNGADVVLCQHSHCIGSYENYEGGHILYGQGNFQFLLSQSASQDNLKGFESDETIKLWSSSLAVRYDTVDNTIEFIPLVATGDGGICIAKGDQKEEILRDFEEHNRMLADGRWLKVWHEFCESLRDKYQGAIANACVQIITGKDMEFGFYVDNQSHIDVWQELFHSANYYNER